VVAVEPTHGWPSLSQKLVGVLQLEVFMVSFIVMVYNGGGGSLQILGPFHCMYYEINAEVRKEEIKFYTS
jgi:hypothetical protein